MSAAVDLGRLGRGFADPALASQAVFRRALEALSRPGRLVKVESDAEVPAGLDPAACALALALLDRDTTLWCSPSLRGPHVGGYLRFHTGCTLVARAQDAQFALVAGVELPALDGFPAGSDEYPDRSTTLIVQAGSLCEGAGWQLAGPGIKGGARVAWSGLPGDFAVQWAHNARHYPRGVDLFLTCGPLVCGLPRTTRIEG